MEGFEFYQGIYKEKEGITLRANGAGAKFAFCLDKKEGKRYRLFAAGGTELFKWWKSEYGYPTLYTTIHDALDCVHAKKARYCLNLSCKRAEEDIKRAYKKVLWKPQYYYIDIHNLPIEWNVGIFAKAKKLKIEKDGYLRMKIELRYNKEGVGRHSVAERADVTQTIDFPEGTYEYTEFCKELTIPPEAASVAILLEGVRYSGEFYVERPYLRGDDIDLLPDFGESEPNKTEFDWCGLHLSRKERPEFEVRLNGKVVFRGEIFERSHCGSEWEIPLPSKLLKKSNTIAYKLISDYRDPLPYTICESAILEQPCGAFCVIAAQKNAGVGGKARVLLRTEKENVLVRFSCESGALKGEEKYLLKEKGLHGIALDCVKPCLNAKFTLEANGTAYPLEIERIAQKTSDGVVTGTGDLIYVHQDEESFEEFLCWYLSNGVGDFVTVRPAYRWSGTRKINLEVWKTFVRVVNELQMNYVHMIDGRDAPGINVNPSFDELKARDF